MRDRKGANVRLPPLLVFATFLLAGMALGYVFRLSTRLPRGISLVAACLLIGGAVALILAAMARFRKAGQNPIPWTPTPALEFHGPYRFTRNPMYVGMTLLQAGLGLGLDNLWCVLSAIPALVVVHYTAVLPEERYLSERFGEPYRQYMSKVRRYI